MTILPFDLKVTSITKAQQLLDQNWPTKIITLRGNPKPGTPEIVSTGSHHLHVRVDDSTIPMPGELIPNRNHIEQILNFSKDFTGDDRVLIHCYAGVSRSTSCAVGVLCQHGIDPLEAFFVVDSLTKDMDPNQLIVYLMDVALNMKCQLIDAYEIWRKNKSYAMWNMIPKSYRNELFSNYRELMAQI